MGTGAVIYTGEFIICPPGGVAPFIGGAGDVIIEDSILIDGNPGF